MEDETPEVKHLDFHLSSFRRENITCGVIFGGAAGALVGFGVGGFLGYLVEAGLEATNSNPLPKGKISELLVVLAEIPTVPLFAFLFGAVLGD